MAAFNVSESTLYELRSEGLRSEIFLLGAPPEVM